MSAKIIPFRKRRRRQVERYTEQTGEKTFDVVSGNKGKRQDQAFWSGLIWSLENSDDSVEAFARRVSQVVEHTESIDPPRSPNLRVVRDNTPPKW